MAAKKTSTGYNKGKYTFIQQTFSLSWSTILSFNFSGTAEEIARKTKVQLLEVLEDAEVRKLIGIWDLVWGPGVYADSFSGETKSLNAMFIAVPRQDPSQAVIAIAGTNGGSLMDWVVEDFNVFQKVPWPYGVSSTNPQISLGTAYGLDKLVTMESAHPHSGQSVTARAFLATQAFTKIMVTGHSLGGALSPCYSLYLEETRARWDPERKVTISVLPTAGPTPGDVSFSNYYDERLLSTTDRQWNSMDVVPHAFNAVRLSQVPTLYEPELSSPLITKIVAWLRRGTEMQLYLNVSPETPGFPSRFFHLSELGVGQSALTREIDRVRNAFEDELEILEKDEEDAPDCVCNWWDRRTESDLDSLGDAVLFIVQALIQHTIGYLVYFEISRFSQLLTEVTKSSTKLLSKPSTAARQMKTTGHKTKTPLLLDVREAGTPLVSRLKAGEGPLLSAILDKTEQASEGTISEGAQQVIFLVEELTD
jgi:hypothetical protein